MFVNDKEIASIEVQVPEPERWVLSQWVEAASHLVIFFWSEQLVVKFLLYFHMKGGACRVSG